MPCQYPSATALQTLTFVSYRGLCSGNGNVNSIPRTSMTGSVKMMFWWSQRCSSAPPSTYPRLLLLEHTFAVRQSPSVSPHRNSLEPLPHPALERIQAFVTDNYQLHPPRTILLFPPRDQIPSGIPPFPPRTVPQRLARARAKLGIRMSRRTQVFLQLKETPDVRLKVFRVFGMDGVDFALDAGGVKERFGEETGEAVERAEEGVGRDFESELAVGRGVSRGASGWAVGLTLVLQTPV